MKHTYEDLVGAGAPELRPGWSYVVEKTDPCYDYEFPYTVLLRERDRTVSSALITRLSEKDIVAGCRKAFSEHQEKLKRKMREDEWLGTY